MNADALLHWLQRTTLEASLLILAVVSLRLMLGTRLSPAWRIGLWMLVGLKLLLPACIPAGFGLGSLWKDARDLSGRSDIAITAPAAVPQAAIVPSTSPPYAIPHSSFFIRHAALAAWLTGALAILGIAFFQQVRFNRYLRRRPRASDAALTNLVAHLASRADIRRAVTVVLMPAGTTPAVVGIRQPKLLLPEDWSTRFDAQSLRHVLLHELLHVKQHDLLWNWVATAVQALHWFNPLVWFAVSRFQADRELRCDAGALAMLAPTERLDYGRTLLRIQESFFAPPSLAGLAPCVRHHPTLRQRLLMITMPPSRQPALQILLVLTLGTLASYSFTTAHATEKEVPPKIREDAATRPSDPSDKSDPSDRATANRDSGQPSAEREGTAKPGPQDGDTPRTGPRDGERPKTGQRDGDRPKNGERDGDKPRTGERDSGKPSAETGRRPSPEAEAARSSHEILPLHVTAGGDTVVISGEKVPMNRLRGFLSTFLPHHPGARIEVSGDGDIPLKALHNVVDAVRDNGNRNVGIKTE